MPFVIVGNKSDLTAEREVSKEQLEMLGQEERVHTFETSAKTGHNVDNAFGCLIFQILKPLLAIEKLIKIDLMNGDHRL